MLGLIYAQYKKYIQQTYGVPYWDNMLVSSSIANIDYNIAIPYPDDHLLDLLRAVVSINGSSREEEEHKFGFFLGHELIKLYGSYIKPNWKTLDLLENAEHYMHEFVRSNNPEASPPVLTTKRVSDIKVTIHYNSHRQLLRLAVGIIQGIADYFGESEILSVDIASYAKTMKSKISVRCAEDIDFNA